jgi:hypothetical protein
MMIGMLVAGIGCLLAGLVAIGFGIPINEFGLGNTLILAGAVTACTGLLILSMWIAVKELKGTAGQLGAAPALDLKRSSSQPVALPRPVGAESGDTAPYADPASGSPDGPPPMPPPPPWSEEAANRGPRQDAPTPEPAAKSRRNLMFSSSSRKERERAQARAGEASVAEPPSASAMPAAPAAEVSAPPPANFDDAWPKSERVRSADAPPRRVARNPSALSEPAAARQAPPVETQPQVTVLKSGVVDGMAYSLYSDGSIEAQMPEGMMRFASIDELRAHLDQRP